MAIVERCRSRRSRAWSPHYTRVCRVVHHYVDVAVEGQDLQGAERVGIDETSSRRGHEYVSVFADLDLECPRVRGQLIAWVCPAQREGCVLNAEVSPAVSRGVSS